MDCVSILQQFIVIWIMQVSFIKSNASGYVENLVKVQRLAKYRYNMNYYIEDGTWDKTYFNDLDT